MTALVWLLAAVAALTLGGVLGVHWLGRALDVCRDWRLDHRSDREL